jgi:hypothetical protein
VNLLVSLADNGWSPDRESLAHAPSVVSFTVHDTGVGIGRDQHQRIFEAFAQGDGTTARMYGGTGLGLSISRALVGLLGGEITVVSTPGKGSTFTVYLPSGLTATSVHGDTPTSVTPEAERPPELVVANGSAANGSAANGSAANGSAANGSAAKDTGQRADPRPSNGLDDRPFAGTKVLVVDDDFRNIFAITALLERGHAQVTAAESGPDAMAALERFPDIDMVLMDIMMPGMDGYAVMRAIRMLEQFKSLPIIAVTGKVVAGERQRCLDAGANGYVPKPVNTAELLAAIGPWLPTKEQVAP